MPFQGLRHCFNPLGALSHFQESLNNNVKNKRSTKQNKEVYENNSLVVQII